jgi:hypothetical protein
VFLKLKERNLVKLTLSVVQATLPKSGSLHTSLLTLLSGFVQSLEIPHSSTTGFLLNNVSPFCGRIRDDNESKGEVGEGSSGDSPEYLF